MRYTKPAAGAAIVLAVLASGAAPANAGKANNLSCVRSGKDVRTALDANKTSPNYEAAMTKRNQGLFACNSGFYKLGMAHYTAALKLLGSTGETSSSRSQ